MKLYSIIESSSHPQFSALYEQLGYEELVFTSMRKAIQNLKTLQPDVVIADFLYGYGNNYAGVNISNLDVFLYSLAKYAPQAMMIALYEKSEKMYIKQFAELFPEVKCVLLPVSKSRLEELLRQHALGKGN
jgi:hypothetical protein